MHSRMVPVRLTSSTCEKTRGSNSSSRRITPAALTRTSQFGRACQQAFNCVRIRDIQVLCADSGSGRFR